MASLIQALISCEALLRIVGEEFWADNLKAILPKGSVSLDSYQLEKLISYYGGMGSFNDLIISHHNGHQVEEKDEDKLNEELATLRNAIYKEAKEKMAL